MIPLSRASQHAIRALTYLAAQPAGDYCLTRTVAQDLEIPASFLAKVLQPLVTRKLLASQRGRSGGVRLARAPNELSLFEIVAAIDNIDMPAECALGQWQCDDTLACPLHDDWALARHAHIARLHNTSLHDMLLYCEEHPESGYPFQLPGR